MSKKRKQNELSSNSTTVEAKKSIISISRGKEAAQLHKHGRPLVQRDESEASGPRSRQLSLLDTSAQERRPVPIRRRHREEVIWPNCRVYPMLASTCTRSASTPPTHRSEGRVISASILAPCPPGLWTPVLHPRLHPIIGSSSGPRRWRSGRGA